MIRHNVLVGGIVVILCVFVAAKERWFLQTTRKGQRLVHWFGETSAVWVLRGLLAFGITFGALLAAGIIRPIQW